MKGIKLSIIFIIGLVLLIFWLFGTLNRGALNRAVNVAFVIAIIFIIIWLVRAIVEIAD